MPNPDGSMTDAEMRMMMGSLSRGAVNTPSNLTTPQNGTRDQNGQLMIGAGGGGFNAANTPTTPTLGSIQDTTGYGSDYDPTGAYALDPSQIGSRPYELNASKTWLTNAQAHADTRNNFYYGGQAGGGAAFNANVDKVGAGQTAAFGQVGSNAGALGVQALNHAQQMGGNAQAAIGRDPAAFIDQQGVANNAQDRARQAMAVGGMNRSAAGLGQTAGQLNSFLANGPGPSAAQAQLNQATDANMNNALALARSGRGMGGSAAGMRQAIAQNAQTQQQSANQSAVLRAQEAQNWQQNQLGAMNQLGSVYGQQGNVYGNAGGLATNMRTGDLGQASYLTGSQQAGQNANDQTGLAFAGLQQGYGNQALGANAQQLGAASANAQAQNQLLGLQNGVNTTNMQGAQNYEQNLQNFYLGQRTEQNKGTDYTPFLAAGGAIAGALIGGPGGAVAGGAAGNAAGNAISSG